MVIKVVEIMAVGKVLTRSMTSMDHQLDLNATAVSIRIASIVQVTILLPDKDITQHLITNLL